MRELQCETAYEWIVRDLDEGLETEKRALLDSHLRGCPSCRRVREQTAALLSSLPADTPVEPDEAFWTRYHSSLTARLQESALSRRPSWGFRWKVAAVMASAALVALIAVEATFQNGGQEQWQQGARYPAVVQELTEFYGPVPDEISVNTPSMDHALVTVDSRAASWNYDLMNWFDFDDDANTYLF